LNFIADWRAVLLHLKDRAEIVIDFNTGERSVWHDESFTSPGETIGAPLKSMNVPATMRLRRYIPKKWRTPHFEKRVLFNRDCWCCQYCGKKLGWSTIEVEHVLPRSRGGTTSWMNCVSACHACNKKKDNMTPNEAGMRLLKKPTEPLPMHFWDVERSNCWHPTWDTFIVRDK